MLDLFESLADRMECPSSLRPVLRKLVPHGALPLLVAASCSWVELDSTAEKFGAETLELERLARKLFIEGFLHLRGRWMRTRALYDLLGTLLSQRRPGCLEPEELELAREHYMLLRLEKWDGYIREGLVSSSSEVAVLKESLERFHRHPHDGTSVVEPFDRAVEVIEEAKIKALIPCSCRLTFGRCKKPLMTCLILGDGAEEMISRGVGREIGTGEAEQLLAIAHREALVHLVLYRPGGPYGVCSCCSCCCHDLQAFRLYGRKNWILPAPYVATHRQDLCSGCGSCVEACAFEARELSGGRLLYDPGKCYGCGVCAHLCPESAIGLVAR